MPRKVSVAIRQDHDASSFPQPPDPTTGRCDENEMKGDSTRTEDPSLRAGFLPPAPKDWNGDGRNNGDNSNHANTNNVTNNANSNVNHSTWDNRDWHEWHRYHYYPNHYWPSYYDNHREGYPEFVPPTKGDGKAVEQPAAYYKPRVYPYAWPQPQPTDETTTSREELLQQQTSVEKLPVPPYDDSFTTRSFDEMLALYTSFRDSHGGVVNLETLSFDGSTNPPSLLLSSWIKELKWTRRARAPSSEKSPKATRGREKVPTFPPLCDSLTLTEERLKVLEEVGFDWASHKSSWQKWLEDLMHFRSRVKYGKSIHKHVGTHPSGNPYTNKADANTTEEGEDTGEYANVPLKYPTYPSLGNFVNRQRTEYRKLLLGKNSSMTQTKMQDLNRVGFLWSVREGGHTSWEVRLGELREYKRVYGHCNVPKLYRENPSLGYWVNEVCLCVVVLIL